MHPTFLRPTFCIILLTKLAISLSLNDPNSIPKEAKTTTMSTGTNSLQKTIKEICRKPPSHWVGDGFNVFPVFANKAFTSELSPFLMFDYAAPKEFPPNKSYDRRGVGQHPHRGFETVTIAFQGEIEHADSSGNRDVIGPGDTQWMTAGRGIVHQEYHSSEFSVKGGLFEMCQLWLNLPSEHKMTAPKYQPLLDKNIPKVELLSAASAGDNNNGVCSVAPLEDGYARIIAGEFRDVKGPAETFTPVNLWDLILLNPASKFEFEIPESHTLLVFVRRGSVKVQGKMLGLADVAIMNKGGKQLTLQSLEKDTSVLILSGEPIDEPIAARGPFVMNTQNELRQAMRDYQSGTNGF